MGLCVDREEEGKGGKERVKVKGKAEDGGWLTEKILTPNHPLFKYIKNVNFSQKYVMVSFSEAFTKL